MSGLEPIFIALAGPMGKLAWAGIMKCWMKYRKHKAKLAGDFHADNDIVGLELDKKSRIIGQLFDRYANRLGAGFVKGDYKARRDLFIINNYGDFRVVRNDISRIFDVTVTSEDHARLFIEDLNVASGRVLQVLQDLASRVDPMFGIDRQPATMREQQGVPIGHLERESDENIISSLSKAFDRTVTLKVTEVESEYCRGAIALQNSTTRKIEDVSIDGTARMQYTYVCKFCFLQISSYQGVARTWEAYEWKTLAMSHIVACTSWLDSRAFFKCIDCHKNGVEAVCIDANDFVVHTQEHLQIPFKPKVSRTSAYTRGGNHTDGAPNSKPFEETMVEVRREIAEYEGKIEMELAGDPVVQKAKKAAEPLVEDDETEQWYQPQPKRNARKRPERASDTTISSKRPFDPNGNLPSNGNRDVSPLRSDEGVPDTVKDSKSPPPYQPSPDITETAPPKSDLPVQKATVPSSPKYNLEQPRDVPAAETLHEKEASNKPRKAARGALTAEKAKHGKEIIPPVPSTRHPTETQPQALSELGDTAEPDDGLISCLFGCGRRMKAEAMSDHLDTCRNNAAKGSLNNQQAMPNGSPIPQSQPFATPVPNYGFPTHSIQPPLETKASSPEAASTQRPAFSDYDVYQPSSESPAVPSTSTFPPVPRHPAPVPPLQQVTRKATTAAQADANYQKQRYPVEQVATSPRTPTNQRSSQNSHARNFSTPTSAGPGQWTSQKPGGSQEWQQQYPSYENWPARQ